MPEPMLAHRHFKFQQGRLWQGVVDRNAKVVFEIGTKCGCSARLLHSAVELTGGKVWSLDINPPDDGWWQEGKFPHLQLVRGDSLEFDPKGFEIDVLLIDGAHNYEHVKVELEKFGGCVKSGGVIFLDDVRLEKGHLYLIKAMEEYCEANNLTWHIWAGQNGLGEINV